MTESDLGDVVAWHAAPHVARWRPGEPDLAAARRKYLPWIRGEHPNHLSVVLADGRARGYAWHYRVGDHRDYSLATGEPDAIGIDVVIGDVTACGPDLAPDMLRDYLLRVVLKAYPDAHRFVSSPPAGDTATIRALAEAGFAPQRDITVFDGEPAETLCLLTIG
ncbi:MAG TPA: GNAT family N-acetyltransferase [Phytomonospora sp.]